MRGANAKGRRGRNCLRSQGKIRIGVRASHRKVLTGAEGFGYKAGCFVPCAQTPVTRRWIAQPLHMGSTGYLSNLLGHDDVKLWGCIDLTDSELRVKSRRSPHENTVIEAGSQQ